MCGLIASVNSRYSYQIPRVLSTIESRGPDSRAIVSIGPATLAHTRLAIVDLESGQQPMQALGGRFSIVFNGEIYNYKTIRETLLKLGHQFQTRSDTEVILHAFAEWGEDCLPMLDGMFAFAIWDQALQTLFCARDRMGIKPLFYSKSDGIFVASTLSPFLALSDFRKALDYQALRDFLAFQAIPAPRSFLTDISQIEPASILTYQAQSNSYRLRRYWNPPQSTIDHQNLHEITRNTDTLIQESVNDQRLADVPLGAFLSGGIDSSLIVHYLADVSGKKIQTFSVRFPQAEFDESIASLAVAKKYGTEHHVYDAPNLSSDALLESIYDLDQPLADPAYLPLTQVAALARNEVKVSLSGDGADELFGGYSRYQKTPDLYPKTVGKSLLKRLISASVLPEALLRRSLSGLDSILYNQVELGPWEFGRKAMRKYLRPQTVQIADIPNTLEKWIGALGFPAEVNNSVLMRADLWTYLSDNCLAKSDRASMRNSLEVRVPFLGNHLIDFALGLPGDVHFAEGSKTVLRRLAKKHLPDIVWSRPKHGFSVPLASYFQGPWKPVVSHFASRVEKIAPFLNHQEVKHVLEKGMSGRGSMRLAYTFLVLLIWLSRHSIDYDTV